MPLTAVQSDLLAAIEQTLWNDPRIDGLWLSGSLGQGGGDDYSDVDVIARVGDPPASRIGREYAERADEIVPVVLVNLLFGDRVLNVVTRTWERFDILFLEPPELQMHDSARLTQIFNRGASGPPMQVRIDYQPSPETILKIVNEFLRVLGLFPVAVGRGEWLLAQAGMELLRRLTIDLMLEENRLSTADRGGALHLNTLLTTEQRQALEGLPAVTADRDSAFAGNRAVAALFLPRARRLAAEVGAAWPDAFEAATRDQLKLRIGFSLP